MRQIVDDVYLLDGIRGGNVYLLVSSQGLTLVDSGMPGGADRIATQIRGAGYALDDLRAIVLTHAHLDHVGSAGEWAARAGAQILAGRDEVPYVERRAVMPAASPLVRLSNRLQALLSAWVSCTVDGALDDGDLVGALGGMRVIHTPGHTPGSICLYQPERRLLFCGDTFFNAHPLTGRPGLRLSIPVATTDVAQARSSARALAALPLETLCCGHGDPILERAGERIGALLEEA
jgi:glyoxylase-like metal-dependent hydrolase (beta-lactamase superfamily II)